MSAFKLVKDFCLMILFGGKIGQLSIIWHPLTSVACSVAKPIGRPTACQAAYWTGCLACSWTPWIFMMSAGLLHWNMPMVERINFWKVKIIVIYFLCISPVTKQRDASDTTQTKMSHWQDSDLHYLCHIASIFCLQANGSKSMYAPRCLLC